MSVDQEFGSGLAGWFQLKVAPEVAVKRWTGLWKQRLWPLYCRSLRYKGAIIKEQEASTVKQWVETPNLGLPGMRLAKTELCKEEQGGVRMSKQNEE